MIADWISVALGGNWANWTAGTVVLVGLLALATACSDLCSGESRRTRIAPDKRASGPALGPHPLGTSSESLEVP